MSDSRHTAAAVSCHADMSHSDATSLLWSYCLNDSLFSLTSAGCTHSQKHTHVCMHAHAHTHTVLWCLPWGWILCSLEQSTCKYSSQQWQHRVSSFWASPSNAFNLHNKETKVIAQSLKAVLSKNVTTRVGSSDSCYLWWKKYMEVWSCTTQKFYINTGIEGSMCNVKGDASSNGNTELSSDSLVIFRYTEPFSIL